MIDQELVPDPEELAMQYTCYQNGKVTGYHNLDELAHRIREDEETVDKLSAGITSYAIKLTSLQISQREHQDVANILQVVSDMERISDYCENISEFAEALAEKKVMFSEVGREHLTEMIEVLYR